MIDELKAAARRLEAIAADQGDLAERQIAEPYRTRMLSWQRQTLTVCDSLVHLVEQLERLGDAASGIRRSEGTGPPWSRPISFDYPAATMLAEQAAETAAEVEKTCSLWRSPST